MAYKQKGFTPFTQDDNKEYDLVIKYDKKGNMISNEEQNANFIKESRNRMIENWMNNPRKTDNVPNPKRDPDKIKK